jgi:hypothetical protein
MADVKRSADSQEPNSKETGVFVAMPTDAKLEHIYDRVIKPILEEQGLACICPSETVSLDTTVDQVQVQIRQADLVICDLTDEVADVFYQLGIAHSLEKPVIMISQTAANLDFRIRRRYIIQYEDTSVGLLDLRDRLTEAVANWLGADRETTPDEVSERNGVDFEELAIQRRALYSASSATKRFALKFLGEWRDAESYALIEQIAKTETDPDTLRDAFTALHGIDPEKARAILMDYGLWRGDYLVRERVVLLLGSYEPDRELVDRMTDQVTDSSWGVRKAVCQVLGEWGKVMALGPLSERLNDPQLQVRMAAANAFKTLDRMKARAEQAREPEKIPEHKAPDLRENLVDDFSEDDLRDICFDMNIVWDDLPADTRGGKARELIIYCERHGRVRALLETCGRMRADDPYWRTIAETIWSDD